MSFVPRSPFVDLETTGTLAAGDRITEVGIVRMSRSRRRAAGAANGARSWIPECSIPAGDPGAHRHHQCDGARRAHVFASRGRGRRAPRRLCLRRAQRALRLRIPQARVRAARRAASAQGPVHGEAVAPAVSRGADATASTAVIERHQLDGADRHRALGDARAPVAVRAGALPRASGRRDRRGGRAHPADAEPAAAARRPTRSTTFRKVPASTASTAERAAALHRQEHQPARAHRCALFIATIAARTTCACRRRSAASKSRRPRASWARCCAKHSSSRRCFPRTTSAACGARTESRWSFRTRPARSIRAFTSASIPAAWRDTTGPSRRARQARETLRNARREARLCWTMLGPRAAARAVLRSDRWASARAPASERRRRCAHHAARSTSLARMAHSSVALSEAGRHSRIEPGLGCVRSARRAQRLLARHRTRRLGSAGSLRLPASWRVRSRNLPRAARAHQA